MSAHVQTLKIYPSTRGYQLLGKITSEKEKCKMAPQSKRWTYTKNNPNVFLQDEMRRELEEKVKDKKCHLQYILQAVETAPTTGTTHWQGFLVLTVRKTLATLKRWIGKHIPLLEGAHLEVMRGTILQNKEYCSKEDKDPWHAGSEPEEKRPGKRTDLLDYTQAVLEGSGDLELAVAFPGAHARYHNYAEKLRRAKRTKDMEETMREEFSGTILRDWQKRALEKLEEQSRRRILWVWSREGNVGKSFLARYIVATKKAFMCNTGKHGDIIYAFSKKTPEYVVMDLSREQAERAPYSVMEGLKNGFLFCAKYESSECFFKPSKLVVFANFQPEREKLSADRWDVMNIVAPERA